jgi:hypothetical protein
MLLSPSFDWLLLFLYPSGFYINSYAASIPCDISLIPVPCRMFGLPDILWYTTAGVSALVVITRLDMQFSGGSPNY